MKTTILIPIFSVLMAALLLMTVIDGLKGNICDAVEKAENKQAAAILFNPDNCKDQ